jgi:hypothetical protein
MEQNHGTAPTHQTGSDKNFVKPMDMTGLAFKYLAGNFPPLSEAKIKEGVFVVPQIRKLFRDGMFNNLLQDDKQNRDLYHLVSTNFFWNIRAENYKGLTEDMSLYHKRGSNMSLNINMLHSHLNFFPDNCDMVSNEHGELFIRNFNDRKMVSRNVVHFHVG